MAGPIFRFSTPSRRASRADIRGAVDPEHVGATHPTATKALNDHRKDLEGGLPEPAVKGMACNVLHAGQQHDFRVVAADARAPPGSRRIRSSHMYRIEFEPGDVGVFRSVEEVATAIKSGVITSRARIYHQATDKWLPIEFHPHYKKAVEMVASGNIPTPSTSARSNGSPFTPPGARAAIQVAPPAPMVVAPPAPVVVEAAHEAPPTINHVELEPPTAKHFEPEPAAEIPPPPVEEETAAPEPAVEMTEPAIVETEAAPPPPDFVFIPRSREIRFIPLEEPKLLGRSRQRHLEHPIPPAALGPETRPFFLRAPSDELRHQEAAPDVLQNEHPASESLAIEAAGMDSLVLAADASARPIFRPRFRVRSLGKLRRPILIGVGALALVVSTRFGISAAASTLNAGVMTSGWGALPFLRDSGADRSGESLNQAQAGGRLPRNPEPQGSPSFGSSSAFPSGRSGSADSRRQPAGMSSATSAAEKMEQVPTPDSTVRKAPLAQIAIAAPKIAGLPGATNVKLTPAVLVTHYEAAYAAARSELETGFRTAGFANVFAPEHLNSAQGVRAARLAAGTASAYVAKYRRREAAIEAAYADSAADLAKSPADRKVWDERKVLQESPEVAKLAGFLLDEIDSVFGVLASQDRAYEIKDGAIVFQDAAAARAYSELRPWLERQAHQWADSAEGTPPSSAGRVLRAIGSTRLPEGGAF
jgi:hypothetical protein